ncbi:hypothetical protein BRADI_4g27251v3 [Brachypodium distachyon]|uniref:DUF4283 domain-containing protein n=1 Tax=Brachypodium distachyon TaxID=15368 RepID=A0A0Q3EQL1_BRADI|nr:hypothetical protein BRADI_4g27251v3 [Brachypodium distachyon]
MTGGGCGKVSYPTTAVEGRVVGYGYGRDVPVPEPVGCHPDSRGARDALLAAGQLDGCNFSLRFGIWNRQLQARLRRLRFRVEMDGVPPHTWDKETAAAILGPACWIERLGTKTARKEDLGRFSAYVWTDDPGLIAKEKILGIPEPPSPLDQEINPALCHTVEDLIPEEVQILDCPVFIHVLCIEDQELSMDRSEGGLPDHSTTVMTSTSIRAVAPLAAVPRVVSSPVAGALRTMTLSTAARLSSPVAASLRQGA